MQQLKLFMLLLGCRPPGRNTEQHDVFFGIGETVKQLIPQLNAFWPEAKGRLHVDAWRAVNTVDSYSVQIADRNTPDKANDRNLFFINLGGYKPGLFDEPHFKMIVVEKDMAAAIKQAKRTDFYKHVQFGSAVSHIDDKFGLDVDEVYPVKELLPAAQKETYRIIITENQAPVADELHLGYFKLSTLP